MVKSTVLQTVTIRVLASKKVEMLCCCCHHLPGHHFLTVLIEYWSETIPNLLKIWTYKNDMVSGLAILDMSFATIPILLIGNP